MNQPKEKFKAAQELLQIHWNFNEFRQGQEKAISNCLAGRSSVIIMPTGGGKSLCYQLPALVLDGATIVISPLIALMKDQVDSLRRLGIPATYVNSSISSLETESRLNMVRVGQYKILYIAPERFYNQKFKETIENLKVSLLAVDEAHCISQWGHDFRPSYIKLKEAIKLLNEPPVIALTATATPEVRNDIIKQLDLDNPEVIITGFGRPNLEFGVIHANERQKPQIVLDAITSAHDEPGIIYVGTRARVDNLLQFLLENNIEAVGYHAGMEPADRRWVQDNFLTGQAKVIIATNAFGLGIDKPDIRYVLHYDMPGTVEAYYQEAGRAGRDGKSSFCLLLYNSRDRHLHEFFIKGDNPPIELIKEIYELLLGYKSESVLITYSEISDNISDSVPDMAIGTSLKMLEKEGYISRSRERAAKAYFKLTKDRNFILDTFAKRAKKQIELFVALDKRYQAEMANGWQVNWEEVSEILEVKKDALTRLARKLANQGLAEYRPPFRGTEIRILERIKSRDLKFDYGALREKRCQAYSKLDKIEEYIYSFGCRQKFILNYFGDQTARPCGKCDVCVTGQGLQRIRKLSRKKENAATSGDPDKIFNQETKSGVLSTKLTQMETLELFSEGFLIKEIAEKRKLKEDTISNHLVYLVEKNLIKNIEKLVDKPIQLKIRRAIKRLETDKLKDIYMELDQKISYQDIKITLAKIKQNKPD